VSPTHLPSFCPDCGGRLRATLPELQGNPPLVCTACGQPIYLDPKVAAACVVDLEGKLVLLRRAQRDSAYGRWILPGGHVDRGEVVTRAARREVAEEVGLKVELEGLVGVYSYPGNPVVLIVYAARAVSGSLKTGSEALEVKTFAPDELPWDEFGFTSTADALRDYLAR